MVDVSGIPNLGIPGLSGFNGGGGVNGIPGASGLTSAQDQYNLNQRFFGNQAQTLAASQVPQSQLYGGGFFGAQPAHYAGVGAAYGRATGGFGGGGGNPAEVDPSLPGGGSPTQVPIASSPFDTENAGAIPYFSGGGMPFGGGGFGRPPTVFDTGTSAVPHQNSPPPGSFSPSPNYPGRGRDAIAQAMMPSAPSFSETFSHFNGPPAHQAQNQPAIDQMLRFNGVGTGVSADTPAAPPSPGADFNERFNIETSAVAGAPGSFADRFSAGNYFQPGTPSEYTTSPYEDVQGQTHQPNIPSGFQTPFNADNPSGALGRGGFRGSQAPIMNSSEGEDTLTAQDAMLSNPFDVGTHHIGPTMGPFMGAQAGGGVGRGTAPSSFAPSSPFEGGTSPVPYPYAGGQAFPGGGVGSAQGGMRDQAAAIMSGSQGNTPPPISGPPFVNGGPQGTGGPMPTQPQMNNAQDMLRGGRGWTVAQQAPPPQAPYGRINQAIFDIGSVSQPGMFDNLSQPLSSMFSPGQHRGAPPTTQPTSNPALFNTKAGPISQSDIDQAWHLSGGRFR